jgi:RNA-directed DNA polymerase
MGKKYKNLIGQIAAMPNLYRAYEKAAAGKRYTAGHLQFKQHLAANLKMLSDALLDGSYKPSEPNLFFVYEPKLRQISAPPFSDRVAQHALCGVIEPIFDRTFLPVSYGCRIGKGSHASAIEAQAIMRRGFTQYLKLDFSKYFARINRSILHVEIRRKISCRATLALIETIVPVTGCGLPIGNLTSQLFANVYGHVLDRYLTHTLKIHPFMRYMDDTIIFAHSRESLAVLQKGLEWFCHSSMGMVFSKWSIGATTAGLPWLGYRIFPTHKLLLKQSVVRAKRKVLRYRNSNKTLELARFAAAWKGHAMWANSHNLLKRMGIA